MWNAQIGNFHMGQRVATFVVRGSQFFLVGFFSSLLGHGLTVNLVRTCCSSFNQNWQYPLSMV